MMRVVRWIFGALVVSVAGLWLFGPYEPVDLSPRFDAAALGNDPAGYLVRAEAGVADLRAGAAKRVVWAVAEGVKTPLAVVYLHGFSASAEEIRPVPDRVAQALGANLVYARFAGHGRSGADAMAEGSVAAWMRDTSEALAVARAVGERVLIIGTSTGATLAAVAATQPDLMQDVVGMALISPNFGVNHAVAPLLTFPAARHWLPMIMGHRRAFAPRSAAQAAHWTTEYPSVAVFPMAALAGYAAGADYGAVTVPALFYFSDADQVVQPAQTRAVMARWGGPVSVAQPELGAGDDPLAHVIAGAIMSPGNTAAAVAAISVWQRGL
ncbi:alpha/beta hydrolase [Thalassovita taeanensis]|uniref:Lysophospholipase, alpha-beta hydrolase superfamily n=1 Tax=Thalassovita taeanensis TaxID=657014 RepID=A0A1H9HEX9_9RHOB|nr:alpha/beta hydrolase [Thalassovita taeanensis]SEQ60875.1 Lysophospholipase, alpha-beta hydrolase superfamily [Thalassovita taeanensis]